MPLDPLLVEVLACPVDKGPLLWFADEDVLYNPRLHRSYAVRDGVPVLLGGRGDRRSAPAEHERLVAKAEAGGAVETGAAEPADGAGRRAAAAG